MVTSEMNTLMPSVRMAGLADAGKITTLINSAFRRAEGFFVEEDRVDCESVRNFLNKGKFLLAESEENVVGCVYVEPRPGDQVNSSRILARTSPSFEVFTFAAA